MSRKNIMLTLFLASPIVVVIGLVMMIFVSLDKEKLMADSPAIGAGAGDTGDANALGQWLAGRDPDAVSLAVKAKRERLMISPRDWPGGIRLLIPTKLLSSENEKPWAMCLFDKSGSTFTRVLNETGVEFIEVELSQEQIGKRKVFISPRGFTDPLHSNRSNSMPHYDASGRELNPVALEPRIPSRDLDVQDPMPVQIFFESVYRDESP